MKISPQQEHIFFLKYGTRPIYACQICGSETHWNDLDEESLILGKPVCAWCAEERNLENQGGKQ